MRRSRPPFDMVEEATGLARRRLPPMLYGRAARGTQRTFAENTRIFDDVLCRPGAMRDTRPSTVWMLPEVIAVSDRACEAAAIAIDLLGVRRDCTAVQSLPVFQSPPVRRAPRLTCRPRKETTSACR